MTNLDSHTKPLLPWDWKRAGHLALIAFSVIFLMPLYRDALIPFLTTPLLKIMGMLLPQIIFALAILGIYGKFSNKTSFFEIFAFKKFLKLRPLPILGWGVVAFLITAVTSLAQKYILLQFGIEINESSDVMIFRSLPPNMLIFIIFSAIFIAPLVEELIFRRYLYTFFAQHLKPYALGGAMMAVLIPSILFAVIHQDPVKIFPLICLSVFLQLLRARYQTLYVPMMVHCIFNTIGSLLLFFICN